MLHRKITAEFIIKYISILTTMRKKLRNYFAGEILSYLSSEKERILYVGKPAGIILLPQFFLLGLTISISYIFLHYITLSVFKIPFWYVIGVVTLLAAIVLFFIFMSLDWLFDFYIITTNKIIDISYAPPFSHNLSSILLDQVRCTEVDTQKSGIVNELLDIGDVTITFDRPTHQEAFTLRDIYHPEQVSLYLSKALINPSQSTIKPFWFRDQGKNRRLRMGEDMTSAV